jgi:hypothetical protein
MSSVTPCVNHSMNVSVFISLCASSSLGRHFAEGQCFGEQAWVASLRAASASQ